MLATSYPYKTKIQVNTKAIQQGQEEGGECISWISRQLIKAKNFFTSTIFLIIIIIIIIVMIIILIIIIIII